MASDVDLVVLGDNPETLEDAQWFEQLRPGAGPVGDQVPSLPRERMLIRSTPGLVPTGTRGGTAACTTPHDPAGWTIALK